MSVNSTTSRSINASKEVVWAVLDDFGGISAWNSGVQNSFTTGDESQNTGLGAERRCELGGKKIVDERITAYTEGESMTVDVWNVEGLPLKSSLVAFTVAATGSTTSEVKLDAQAVPKLPGFLVKLMGPLLSKSVAKQFAGLLDELATEAEKRQAGASV